MALLPALSALARGEFANAFNYAFIPQETINTSERLTTELVHITEERARRGLLSQQETDKRIAAIQLSGDYRAQFEIPELSPYWNFKAGLEEGKNNIRETMENSISTGTKFSAGLIPWQVWAIAAVAAALYLLPLLAPLIIKRK